ncbi:MAG: DNA methylase [Gammaproteobacteria bacterium]|nr:DNA methylase [Gammaproteobacteria bacterium]
MAAKIGAAELGIDPRSGEDSELFKWFVASYLFGKRISGKIAADAWRVIVEKHGRDTPRKLCNCSWQELVDMLGEGHYKRYDESTASRLLETCKKLNEDYGGSLSKLAESCDSRAERERRLRAFKGVGPKTVQIFMREVPERWKQG